MDAQLTVNQPSKGNEGSTPSVPTRFEDCMFKQTIDLDGDQRRALEKLILAGLKQCIADHGPITKPMLGSASKRIIAIIKCNNKAIRMVDVDWRHIQEDLSHLLENDSIGG